MARYIVTIGSNVADRNMMVAEALRGLSRFGRPKAATPVYTTPDAYHPEKPAYSNAVAIIESTLSATQLDVAFKQMEMEMGRDRTSDAVEIDLDVVVCDDTVIRPRDYSAPYFIKGLSLLQAISGGNAE